MNRRLLRVETFLVLVMLVFMPRPAIGQEPEAVPQPYDESGVWVYASYMKVPWSRIDSLMVLQHGTAPAWREKAIEMGCFLDWQMLIHHTGSEYNVVYLTTYDSWEHLTPGRGCGNTAWQEVMPDSTARAAVEAGLQWVHDEYKHYDEIYWQPFRRP